MAKQRRTEIQHHEPPVEHREPPVVERAPEAAPPPVPPPADDWRFWPVGKPIPTGYRRPGILPCPSCKRLRRDDRSQAVVLVRGGEGTEPAYMRCRLCGHRFKVPVIQ